MLEGRREPGGRLRLESPARLLRVGVDGIEWKAEQLRAEGFPAADEHLQPTAEAAAGRG
jgi:hypothetical protein